MSGGISDKTYQEMSNNERIVDGWNYAVPNETDMRRMFDKPARFDQPISKWNVSCNTDMNKMFDKPNKVNRPIGRWSVLVVTTTICIFAYISVLVTRTLLL